MYSIYVFWKFGSCSCKVFSQVESKQNDETIAYSMSPEHVIKRAVLSAFLGWEQQLMESSGGRSAFSEEWTPRVCRAAQRSWPRSLTVNRCRCCHQQNAALSSRRITGHHCRDASDTSRRTQKINKDMSCLHKNLMLRLPEHF